MRAFVLLFPVLLLCGCERLMRDMYDQPRYKPFAESRLFPDGTSARTAVAETVTARTGGIADSSGGRLGVPDERRPAVTLPLLERGRERFDIYCAPCHSPVGDGDGMVVRRGFPRPPTYHSNRLRSASDQHFYEVITRGHGLMRSYAGLVPPADRWAIVEYIRALQLSQHARAEDVK